MKLRISESERKSILDMHRLVKEQQNTPPALDGQTTTTDGQTTTTNTQQTVTQPGTQKAKDVMKGAKTTNKTIAENLLNGKSANFYKDKEETKQWSTSFYMEILDFAAPDFVTIKVKNEQTKNIYPNLKAFWSCKNPQGDTSGANGAFTFSGRKSGENADSKWILYNNQIGQLLTDNFCTKSSGDSYVPKADFAMKGTGQEQTPSA